MNSKELKKLSRNDLLEMLLALRKENDHLRRKLDEAQKQLEDRSIRIANAGNLAEAALSLNGVFEAAQEACEQYMLNVRRQCDRMELQARERCDAMLAEARMQADPYGWLTEVSSYEE